MRERTYWLSLVSAALEAVPFAIGVAFTFGSTGQLATGVAIAFLRAMGSTVHGRQLQQCTHLITLAVVVWTFERGGLNCGWRCSHTGRVTILGQSCPCLLVDNGLWLQPWRPRKLQAHWCQSMWHVSPGWPRPHLDISLSPCKLHYGVFISIRMVPMIHCIMDNQEVL